MRTTIREIAAAANVSGGTVSRALKNQPGLSALTRQRVLAVAAELGYDAGRLQRGKIERVTFLVSPQHQDFRKSPFFWDVFQGVEQACRENGIAPSVLSVRPAADIEKQLKVHAPDALLVAGFVDPDVLGMLKMRGQPVVLVDLYDPGLTCVNPDNEQGASLAMQHLFDMGRKQVAFIGGSLAHYSIAQRATAYRKAYFDAGMLFNPALEVAVPAGMETDAGAAEAMHGLLDRAKPDAVFAYNDIAALAAMRVCRDRGVRIPEDIAFVGFDDISLAANATPSLTTIAVDKYALGYTSARVIIDATDVKSGLLLPVTLIHRSSTGVSFTNSNPG